MAELLALPKTTCHVRSISLPSRSHPLIVNVEDHLCRLRASEAESTSSASICRNLDRLKNLYECVNDMLQLPLAQQSLSHEPQEKWAEEILDGSLRLLDVCGTAKDVLMQVKESVQDLESSLRRRRGAGSDLANDIGAYMVSRKKVNKMISKCIKILKSFEKTCPSMPLDKDSSLVAVVSMLREVEAISLSTIKSLLCFVSGSQAKSKKNGWSLVTKMMQPKRVSCETEEEADINEIERVDTLLRKSKKNGWSLVTKMMQPKRVSCETEEEADINEIERVDTLLRTQNIQKLSKDIELVPVMRQLETSGLAMQELEDGLESVFRCLMKTRFSLLNMLNH